MISIEDCVELAIRGLKVYVHGSEERLIQAARGDKIPVPSATSNNSCWLKVFLLLFGDYISNQQPY